jgi:hypothetical protein
LSRSLVALDQNSTIIAVIEMSQSSWLVLRRDGCLGERKIVQTSIQSESAVVRCSCFLPLVS